MLVRRFLLKEGHSGPECLSARHHFLFGCQRSIVLLSSTYLLVSLGRDGLRLSSSFGVNAPLFVWTLNLTLFFLLVLNEETSGNRLLAPLSRRLSAKRCICRQIVNVYNQHAALRVYRQHSPPLVTHSDISPLLMFGYLICMFSLSASSILFRHTSVFLQKLNWLERRTPTDRRSLEVEKRQMLLFGIETINLRKEKASSCCVWPRRVRPLQPAASNRSPVSSGGCASANKRVCVGERLR